MEGPAAATSLASLCSGHQSATSTRVATKILWGEPLDTGFCSYFWGRQHLNLHGVVSSISEGLLDTGSRPSLVDN